MKNLTLIVLALALAVMPYTYYYFPTLQNINKMKQENANIRAVNTAFNSTPTAVYFEFINSCRTSLNKRKSEFNFQFPTFETAKANLMGPFIELRKDILGEWNIVPEGKFTINGALVFWTFNFKFNGTFENALKALAYIETSHQFMKIENYRIESKDNSVELSGKLELVYQEKLHEENK